MSVGTPVVVSVALTVAENISVTVTSFTAIVVKPTSTEISISLIVLEVKWPTNPSGINLDQCSIPNGTVMILRAPLI